MLRLKKTLEDLVVLPGPPGFEDKIRNYIINEIEGLPRTKWAVDGIGNLLVKVQGNSGTSKKVLFDAHMDEPCFLVKQIDDQGFLHFVQLGFVNESVMIGQPVMVHGRLSAIPGTFGVQSFHLSASQDYKKSLSFEDMWIDVGACSKEDVLKMGIRPGSPVTFDASIKNLLNDCIMGRAMDNRTGCAIALELVRIISETPQNNDVIFSFSVQEEMILRGSLPVIRSIKRFFKIVPDFAFAFDICAAGDFPGIGNDKFPIFLHKGFGIKVYDRSSKSHYSHVTPVRLLQEMERIAEENSLPFQYDFLPGSTNSDVFALEESGILAGGISIPCRYTHSPVETISLLDMQKALQFALALVKESDLMFENTSIECKSSNWKE